MSVRQRIRRLERLHPPGSPTLWTVFADVEGCVLDDGSVGVKPWIGKHYSLIPKMGWLIIDVDPLVVFGRRPAARSGPSSSAR